ncbi:MAG: hypothetical protein ACJAZ9_000280 [Neolewinella sp.]|jgi:hypothetical protein
MTTRILIVISFLTAASLTAQESLFDYLIDSGDTIVINMETDWNKIIRRKEKKENEALNCVVETKDSTFEFRGKVRSRGNIRLKVCSNPSLKVKLKKKDLLAAGFSDINDFKLVLQCSNSSLGLSYLRKERLVYELHQIYSPHYHRTIPVRLRGLDDEDIHGFLIEEEEQLEHRYGKVIKLKKANTRGMQREAYLNMCLFNYLILNSDWHIFNLHNVELVSPSENPELIPIPYDFDYSGFVGTSYSVPREGLNVSSIYVPVWLGKYITSDEMKDMASKFLANAGRAEALITNYPGLKKSDRRRMLKRLEDFNKLMANEKKLLKLIK